MTCAEARLLLDHGVAPGSTGGRNPQLGFHLAQCADCRAYRDQTNRRLLAALLSAPLDAAPPAPAASRAARVSQTESASGKARPASRLYRRYLALGAVAGTLALLLFGLWYFALPVYRAYRNVQLMQQPLELAPDRVAAARQSPSATPVSVLTPTPTPTPTTVPSSTPTPTPTPTPAPSATPTPTPTPSLPPAQPVTIALLGLDARPGEGFAARSDALMLARLGPAQGRVALLSMPRDMWVAIPGYGENKINAAYFYGEHRAPGRGLALARETLARAFGVQVDHAVVIDFQGFRSLIDTLGGITLDVPKELYDGHFPTDDYGYTVAHFLPGPQTMDGAAALTYARTRHPDSDFERIKRQQHVLVGIAQRLKERGALQNLHEADALTQALAPFVQTDMPADLVLSLLWSMRDIDPAQVQRYTVDGSMLWETSVGGAYALLPQPGRLSAMGQKLLAPSAP